MSIWLFIYAVCFLWLLTATLNALVLNRELKTAIEKRSERPLAHESERTGRMMVVTTFLLLAPYLYFRYTNDLLAVIVLVKWNHFKMKRRERKHKRDSK